MADGNDRLELVLGKGTDNARIRARVGQIEASGDNKSAWFRSALIAQIDLEEGGGNGAVAPGEVLKKQDIIDILEQYLITQPGVVLSEAPIQVTPEDVSPDDKEKARIRQLLDQAEASWQ